MSVQKTKTLRGKYQITQDIFATCYVNILEATDTQIRTFLGLQRRSDTLVPVGTRIYFDAEAIQRQNERYDIFSIKVLAIEEMDGKPLHVCTPILKETRRNRRTLRRHRASFSTILTENAAPFRVINGAATSREGGGLLLETLARQAMLSLALGQGYHFDVMHKDKAYRFSASLRHIQYDWKTHTHRIGVAFDALSEEQQMILNFLLDPEFTIDVSGTQIIDTAAGKISRQDI